VVNREQEQIKDYACGRLTKDPKLIPDVTVRPRTGIKDWMASELWLFFSFFPFTIWAA
jgi:hypothetical protein